jgi:hypothetical protein
MWQVFHEGVRQSIGFGTKQNFALENAAAQRSDWPIEWGGEIRHGRFIAQVAIARFNFDDYATEKPNLKQVLAVFKILTDGTSCLVGSVSASKQQNQKAHAMATAAQHRQTC